MVMSTEQTNRRKHFIQMNSREADAVTTVVNSIRGWQGLNQPHINERKAKWNVTDAEILSALRSGQIVEVHNNVPGELRAVIREDIGFRSVCVTVSLTTKSLVTVWVNTVNDNHFTLRTEEYGWQVNLLALMAAFRKQVAS